MQARPRSITSYQLQSKCRVIINGEEKTGQSFQEDFSLRFVLRGCRLLSKIWTEFVNFLPLRSLTRRWNSASVFTKQAIICCGCLRLWFTRGERWNDVMWMYDEQLSNTQWEQHYHCLCLSQVESSLFMSLRPNIYTICLMILRQQAETAAAHNKAYSANTYTFSASLCISKAAQSHV